MHEGEPHSSPPQHLACEGGQGGQAGLWEGASPGPGSLQSCLHRCLSGEEGDVSTMS